MLHPHHIYLYEHNPAPFQYFHCCHSSFYHPKELQGFLDKVSRMTVQQVDSLYARKPDKTDTFDGEQVYHYEVTDSFRIHVIIEEGYYKIIRLDPNHRVHR